LVGGELQLAILEMRNEKWECGRRLGKFSARKNEGLICVQERCKWRRCVASIDRQSNLSIVPVQNGMHRIRT
jgi:hypothetical protein